MDLLNKEKITNIVICIFIILSLTYLYNMNLNNPKQTKTENFAVLMEKQTVGTNQVLITNVNQVVFEACVQEDGVNLIKLADENKDWSSKAITLQDMFNTKLDNSGVIGKFRGDYKPLQGIELNDSTGNMLVKIGDNIDNNNKPTNAITINNKSIQFGNINNDRHIDSASIFVGKVGKIGELNLNQTDLHIVGMSDNDGNWNSTKISMWANAGLSIYGSTNITGALNVTTTGTIGNLLTVTSGGANITGGLNVTSVGANITGGLNVTSVGANITGGLNVTSGGANITGILTCPGPISFLPRLCIIMFSGSSAPFGWAICDGENGTPDLRGRFVLGSGKAKDNNVNTWRGDSDNKDAGYTTEDYSVGMKGGIQKQTLTVAQMPSHNHRISDLDRTGNPDGWGDGGRHYYRNASYQGHRDQGKLTDTRGNNQPHTNMPPYYVLLYIMKL